MYTEYEDDIVGVSTTVESDPEESGADTKESSLSYFGADFDIDGLVRRVEDGDIYVPRFNPDETEGSTLDGFQRGPVWTFPRMEKFIESILLGWPVPSIFLVRDLDERYLVLDGQQRLLSLQYFMNGKLPSGRIFELKDVREEMKGVTYASLNPDQRRRFKNTFIQAVVIEGRGKNAAEDIYTLFGRLNSGGVALNPQEVRVAIFRGLLVDWIRDLSHDNSWLELVGRSAKRLRDHELILRSLALLEALDQDYEKLGTEDFLSESYVPPMSNFLNSYLERHRNLQDLDTEIVGRSFSLAVRSLFEAFNVDGLRIRGKINAAYVDSVVSSLMYLAMNDRLPSVSKVRAGVSILRENQEYLEAISESTSHRASVKKRLTLALTAFDTPA